MTDTDDDGVGWCPHKWLSLMAVHSWQVIDLKVEEEREREKVKMESNTDIDNRIGNN